jgi:subfamily B ATP-binding cassette protein MsbA
VTGNSILHGLERGITFEQVCFRYGASRSSALNNLSFQIDAGKVTALVGPSGAGKSTLINLICRFYEATAGEIYADDVPLTQIDIQNWRSHIAIVNQEIHIFDTTVKENIAYGRLDATEADIVMAAKQAHAHEFIVELPLGYDTPVGDRGLRLSGGQRQRLALARAIVRDPDILILDEATNALDTLSEHLIQQALDQFSRDRTVIVIAHRLSTIEQADKIVVLDKGEVVEQGTLSQLIDNNSLFNKLYQLQYRHALPHSRN